MKSDADVLLILRESSHERFFDRIPEYQMEAPIPVDVFPYTLNEIEEMKRKGNTLIKRALKEGHPIVIASPHRNMAAQTITHQLERSFQNTPCFGKTLTTLR